MRSVPQRELRNDVARVLRDVEAGETVEVTVRGRPVAELRPITRRAMTPRTRALGVLAPGSEDDWLAELLAARAEADTDERDVLA